MQRDGMIRMDLEKFGRDNLFKDFGYQLDPDQVYNRYNQEVIMKRNTPEADFVKDFATLAGLKGMLVEIIPDPTSITADNRRYNREKKRPFDFILVTPLRVICIEAKYQYGKQKDHQIRTEQRIERVNLWAYYLIRKKILQGKNVTYSVEKNGQKIATFKDLSGLVNYFRRL